MVGLVDGGVLGYWQIIKPQAGTNLVTNPSFEVDGAGWTVSSASFARVPASRFGAWCGMLTAVSVNGIVSYNGPILTVGTLVVASAWILADSANVFFRLNYGASSFQVQHPGDSQWHRLEVTTTAVAATIPGISVIDARSSAWTPVYVDGVQFETGVSIATTYIDGDQDGCTWNGAPHASTSTRDGRDGRGGQIVSLDSVGLRITGWKGSGAPPVDVATQTLALGDGEIYQRSTAKSRVLMLQGLIIGDATGLPSWHAQRRTIIDLFRPDGRTNRGPITLRYAGPSIAKRLQTYYQGGLEMDSLDATIEKPEIKMLAPQPDWQGETDESAALTASTNLTVNNIAYRNRNGVWSSLGGGTSIPAASLIQDVGRLPDGRIVAAGYFNDMGGVGTADLIAVWDGTAWASLGGWTVAGGIGIECMAVAQNGDVYVGGNFLDGAGIGNADRIAKWTYATNTWSALSTGANNMVVAMTEDPATGYIWCIGDFTTIGGVAANTAAYWNGSTFVSVAAGAAFGSGTLGEDIVVGPDGRMYATGNLGVYVWTGSTWALIGTASGSGLTYALFSSGGLLYAAGGFTSMSGVAANRIAAWNGTTWAPLGAGAASGFILTVGALRDGTVYAAGQNWGTIGGVAPPDNIAQWNGSVWRPFPANPPDSGTHTNDRYFVKVLPDDSVVVWWSALSGTFGTTMTVPSSTTVTNSGSAISYPVITISTTGLIYGLFNRTTNQSIVINGLNGAVSGTVTIDLRPGQKTVKGPNGVILLPSVLPGADLATFCLAPGVNVIDLYVSGTTTATIRWRDAFWSAD